MKIRIVKRNVEVDDAVLDGPWSAAVNGHRGGVDKRCQIDVDLLPARAVRAEDTDAELFAAVARAADRTARSIARTIEQEHGFAAPRNSRGRHSFADSGTRTRGRPQGR